MANEETKKPSKAAGAASAKMKAAGQASDLRQSNADKENVAKEAQALRVQIEHKDKALTQLSQRNESLSAESTALALTIAELQTKVADLEGSIPPELPEPVASRNEIGKHAAVIFGHIIAANSNPQTIISPKTAREAVDGAKMLCRILDKEFPEGADV